MFEVYVREEFDAAHYLPGYAGKCADMHGHTWAVELTVRSTGLESDMVADFADVRATLMEILPDHKVLNDLLDNPTAERLAEYFYTNLKERIPGLSKVVVWESVRTGAAYFED
ncbi:MAG: 6-pyruvoyl trahydropterin synthase family protein [Candidatus Aquicultorales bacterium]